MPSWHINSIREQTNKHLYGNQREEGSSLCVKISTIKQDSSVTNIVCLVNVSNTGKVDGKNFKVQCRKGCMFKTSAQMNSVCLITKELCDNMFNHILMLNHLHIVNVNLFIYLFLCDLQLYLKHFLTF